MDIQAKTRNIANYLPGWRYDSLNTDKSTGILICEGGRIIHIKPRYSTPSMYEARGAVRKNTKYASHCNYDFIGNSVGFSKDKPAKIIAKDIQRRLLPDFELKLKSYVEGKYSDKEKEQILHIRKENIAKAIPELQEETHCRSYNCIYRRACFSLSLPGLDHMSIHLDAYAPLITLDLRDLPDTLAYQVLNLIIDYQRKKTNDQSSEEE